MSDIQGKVVRVLSPMELVINLGKGHGLTESSRFVVFALGDEMLDPDTGEALGQLEIVRGRAEVKHIQEKVSTIRSVEKKRITRDRQRRSSMSARARLEFVTEEVEVAAPFEGVEVGDLVRVL